VKINERLDDQHRFRGCLSSMLRLRLILAVASRARPAGRGLSQAASTPDARLTRQRCCRTARCLSSEALVLAAFSQVRNCTIQKPEHGVSRATSTPHVVFTRRPCCPTAWSSLQEALVRPTMVLRARNCTIRAPGPGHLPAASTPHAFYTRRPCCPTEWC
jgi:hypothetical protein